MLTSISYLLSYSFVKCREQITEDFTKQLESMIDDIEERKEIEVDFDLQQQQKLLKEFELAMQKKKDMEMDMQKKKEMEMEKKKEMEMEMQKKKEMKMEMQKKKKKKKKKKRWR